MTKSEQYLSQFELKLRCETNSEATIKNYLSATRLFFEYCNGMNGEPNILLQNHIVWALKKHAPRSINLHRAAIVKFFGMVKGIKITVQDVPRKRQPKTM